MEGEGVRDKGREVDGIIKGRNMDKREGEVGEK